MVISFANVGFSLKSAYRCLVNSHRITGRFVPEADMAVSAKIIIEILAIPPEPCTILAFTYGSL
jgi:hypothetical protein